MFGDGKSTAAAETGLARAGRGLPGPRARRLLLLVSPLAIVGVGHLVARIAADMNAGTAWLWVAAVYWGLIAAVLAMTTDAGQRRAWFRRSARRQAWVWIVGLLLGLFPLAGILALNLGLVAQYPGVFVAVLAFALVNPVFEEVYWRGALLDAGRCWPFWAIALYSTVLFVAGHPLMWGVFSIGNRSVVLYATLFVMGLAWSCMRRATGSLRISMLSHGLVDVGNLSVFVFMNLYIPPGM